MPVFIIKRVKELTKKERVDSGLHFRNKQNEMFEWENEDYG